MKYRSPIQETYDRKADSFNIWYLIGPCAVLALLINEVFWTSEPVGAHKAHHHSIFYYISEILWTFSIYLEAVAIVPQLVMVHAVARQQGGFVEALTADYVFTLGGYRAMYLINWIYRIFTEAHYRAWIVWLAGLVQTGIYCDFFYYYCIARMSGQRMSLPI
jgi:ER lumen protein retaining receptor